MRTEVAHPAKHALRAVCAHCGLDVPGGLIEPDAERQFCCSGCRAAWTIINTCGLDRYYKVLGGAGAPARPARGSGRKFGEMDDGAFTRAFCVTASDGTRTTELALEGLHCAACVWLLERLDRICPGVVESRLDFGRSLLRLRWDPERAALSAIARALDALGYTPHPARGGGARAARRREDRRMLIRLGVAGACAGNVMLLAFALYAGLFDEMDPAHRALFRWASMLIGLVSLAWPGAIFFRGAWWSVRTRTPHLDLPIGIALAVGGVWSVVSTVRGDGEVYFDTVSALVFALLIGRVVQQRSQRAAAESVQLLFSLTPSSARRVEGDAVIDVPIEAVREGDVVEVRAGESVPADGHVVAGESSVDQSLLTGESRPVRVGPGRGVAAGTVNLSGALRLRVETTGEATRVGRLMKLVEEASRRKAPLVRRADRAAAPYVVGMLLLGGATAVAWLLIDPARALDHVAAVLLVTCPCALGIATPLAVTAAIGRAARRGMLVKGGDVLQVLSGRGTIVLDKTGTITEGRTAVVWHKGSRRAMQRAAAVERSSAHPVARALVAAFDDESLRAASVEVGRNGVEGEADGVLVAVGNGDFVRERIMFEPEWSRRAEAAALAEGLTPILVANDGQIVGVCAMGDPVREDSPAAVEQLRRLGWSVRVLSGDRDAVVKAAARSLGVGERLVRADASPEEKVEEVVRLRSEGPVVMVGDGVNDAAALAAADAGISVRGGAEASLAAADVHLRAPGLSPVVELVSGARRTFRAMRFNLAINAAYNLGAGAFAMAGAISPLTAAIIMPVSSLTVLALSVRTGAFRGAPCR